MSKHYTPKLTESQFFHVLQAIHCYEDAVKNGADMNGSNQIVKLHHATEEALMKEALMKVQGKK